MNVHVYLILMLSQSFCADHKKNEELESDNEELFDVTEDPEESVYEDLTGSAFNSFKASLAALEASVQTFRFSLYSDDFCKIGDIDESEYVDAGEVSAVEKESTDDNIYEEIPQGRPSLISSEGGTIYEEVEEDFIFTEGNEEDKDFDDKMIAFDVKLDKGETETYCYYKERDVVYCTCRNEYKIRKVFYNKRVIWSTNDPENCAKAVILHGKGKHKKMITIHFLNGTIRSFVRNGKNEKWRLDKVIKN